MPEFLELRVDHGRAPHYFALYQHSTADATEFRALVEDALRAWDLTVTALRAVATTGFDATRLQPLVTEFGRRLLPQTPPNDVDLTKSPPITDLTEIVAIRLLRAAHPEMRFPRPRVLHKEWTTVQHRGIDLIGYVREGNGYRLVVVEVMASVQEASPPSTVGQHRDQLLGETLAADPPMRLIRDLASVLDDCTEDADSNVLNDAITAVIAGRRPGGTIAVAVAVLVREPDSLRPTDWNPFWDDSHLFATARIPADVRFLGIQCDKGFCDLLDEVKRIAIGDPEENAA